MRVVDLGQRFDRGQEGVVGQAGVVEDAEEVAAEQAGAQAAEPEGGQAWPARASVTIWWASHRSVWRPPAWVAASWRSRAVEK